MNSPRPQPAFPSQRRRRILPPAFLLLALALPATGARAETTGSSGATEIASLPFTITAPGVYCLRPPAGANPFDPAATPLPGGFAIAINASNVVLDLNGYTLSNPGAPSNNYVGVYSGVAGGVHNVTVRNGTIAGFTKGVFLYTPNWDYSQCYGFLLEDLHISGTGYSGIEIYGGGHTVRRCRVDNNSATGGYYGIGIQGPGARVLDNDISDLAPSGANTYGVFFNSGADCLVAGNRFSRVLYGVYYYQATGKYRDNLMGLAVTTPFTGGTDAGNNN